METSLAAGRSGRRETCSATARAPIYSQLLVVVTAKCMGLTRPLAHYLALSVDHVPEPSTLGLHRDHHSATAHSTHHLMLLRSQRLDLACSHSRGFCRLGVTLGPDANA